jgi:hypothetical protein
MVLCFPVFSLCFAFQLHEKARLACRPNPFFPVVEFDTYFSISAAKIVQSIIHHLFFHHFLFSAFWDNVIMASQKRRLGRIELLSWINNTIDADYARIEDLSDGIAYCQIVDSLFPGRIPLHKLAFDPKRTEDRVANLQAFSDGLRSSGYQKQLPLARLASGKFADHAELLQDMYDFVSRTNPTMPATYSGYDVRAAAAARAEKGSWGFVSKSEIVS